MYDIHQWDGFDWFRQSWPFHWCMPSLHLEWYYATNDSGVHFYFCSSVVASSPLKVLSLMDFFMSFMNFLWTLMSYCDIYETMWCMLIYLEWQLNCNKELFIKCNRLFKVLKDSELSSPAPRTFQGSKQTPCDISFKENISHNISHHWCFYWFHFFQLSLQFLNAAWHLNFHRSSLFFTLSHLPFKFFLFFLQLLFLFFDFFLLLLKKYLYKYKLFSFFQFW